MTSIDWTDAQGTASLTNGKPFPGDRFASWTPDSDPFTDGDEANALGTADWFGFIYRDDHSASFELRGIPYNSLDKVLRLQQHLESGGTVALVTGDPLGSTYPACGLYPDTEVAFVLSDKTNLEYTLMLRLLNVASPRLRMVCVY